VKARGIRRKWKSLLLQSMREVIESRHTLGGGGNRGQCGEPMGSGMVMTRRHCIRAQSAFETDAHYSTGSGANSLQFFSKYSNHLQIL
jgi:hypothetical protein